MKPAVKNNAQTRPKQPTQLPKIEIPSSSMYGFPVSDNQFQLLQDSQLAVSTGQVQIQDRLVDPRKTRLERQRATRGTLSREFMELWQMREFFTLYHQGMMNREFLPVEIVINLLHLEFVQNSFLILYLSLHQTF